MDCGSLVQSLTRFSTLKKNSGCTRLSSFVVVACRQLEFSAPLQPTTRAGKLLSSVLQNDRSKFDVAVQKQLEQLALDRDVAVSRVNLSFDSDEALLNRRIVEVQERECQAAVEDIMYMLISYRFSGIRVHLVPRLSKCTYNGRLEIWPCRDWELESIHSFEVLELVREHLTYVLGWKEKSSVKENWAPSKLKKLQLCQVYTASALYGYFLKSASLRHHMEQKLTHVIPDLGIASSSQLLLSEMRSLGSETVPIGYINGTRSTSVGEIPITRSMKPEKLKYYVMRFDPDTLQMCSKPKSKEALNLVEKHSYALFGDEKTGLVATDEVISTSLASLKRIVLEAIAFGSFLWDAEEHISTVYKLKDN